MVRLNEDVPKWNSTSCQNKFIDTENFKVDDSNLKMCIWDGCFPKTLYQVTQAYPAAVSLFSLIYLIRRKNDFKLRHTTTEESYIVLYQFIWASLLRIIVSNYLVIPGYKPLCADYAFLENFAITFEIESLTHLCIDRFVCASYIMKGWEVNSNHWLGYLCYTSFLAILYSSLPYNGILGNYTHDFNCATCTVDMILPKKSSWVILTFFFAKAIKPVLVMVLALFMAYKVQQWYSKKMEKRNQRYFTNVVSLIAVVNVLCWSTWGLIRMQVFLDQLTMGGINVPCECLLKLGLCMYTISPFFTFVVITFSEKHLRAGRLTFSDIVRYYYPIKHTIITKKASDGTTITPTIITKKASDGTTITPTIITKKASDGTTITPTIIIMKASDGTTITPTIIRMKGGTTITVSIDDSPKHNIDKKDTEEKVKF